MRKNVAGQKVGAQLVSSTDGSAVTSGTTTVYVTGDAGTQAAGSVGSGACTHEGNGYWTYAPDQAETNYNLIAFTFVNSSAVNATVQVYTESINRHDTVRLGLTALPNAAADAAGGLIISDAGSLDADAQRADVAAILVDTGTTLDGRIPAALVGGRIDANVGAISGDSTAADNLEAYTDGTTPAPVNATQISGDSMAADNLEAACDGTGFNIGAGQVVAASVAGNVAGSVLGSVSVAMPAIDGLTFETWASAVLAIVGGKASVSGNTVTFYRADGTTVVAEVIVGSTPGERTSSVVS